MLAIVSEFEEASGICLRGSNSHSFLIGAKTARIADLQRAFGVRSAIDEVNIDGTLMRLGSRPSDSILSQIAHQLKMRWNQHSTYLSAFGRSEAINSVHPPAIWRSLGSTGLPSPNLLTKAFRDAIQPHLNSHDSYGLRPLNVFKTSTSGYSPPASSTRERLSVELIEQTFANLQKHLRLFNLSDVLWLHTHKFPRADRRSLRAISPTNTPQQ